ncbi:MAG TPA: DNA primase [Chthoniobacterales bacterium]|nr:DNA primase [Chthoniobacterales bacterium]
MGTIPTHTIEQIAAANDIVEVIGSYFPLKRAGTTWKALCPFHQEKSPSFTVNPQRQIFKCFGCGVGGSVFRFVMDYEHIDFPTSVRRLAARVGIPIIEETGGSTSDEDRQHEARRTLLKLHAEAADWFQSNLLKSELGAPAREYLKRRGIGSAIAKSWQLGFAPESWDALLTWALERGYKRATILQSGLVKLRDEDRPESDVYDRFRGRLMFPICNDLGEAIAFSGRILTSETESAKYLNSPETPLFRKGRVLFGLHKTKRALIEAESAIVCEGQLDLITLFEAGLTNVVAPQGTAFTEAQARILKRYVNEAVLCFDADAAGEKAAERSLEPLLQNDLVVRVAAMPPGEDPDSLVRAEGAEKFRERIAAAPQFFDYWIDRAASAIDLSNLTAKLQLARELAETVGRVHEPLMRNEVISKVASRLGVSAADFANLLPKTSRTQTRDAQRTSAVAPAPSHEIAMLCLLALRDNAARDYLLAQDWPAAIEDTPGTELLGKILAGDFRPDDPASLNLFLASLPAEEESLVSGWLLQKMPPQAETVAREWWLGLRQPALRRRLQAAESRLKLPQVSAGEVVALQKQVVDLRGQLDDFSRFSPSRSQEL